MQEQQMEMMEEMYQDGYGGDENEMEDDEEDDEDDMEEESARTVTIDGETVPADEAVARLRAGADDTDPSELETQTEDRAEGEEDSDTPNDPGTFGFDALR